ncbi:MAG: phosphoribosyl-ATP diphosphatase [Halothiobacillaceae bacterium]
MNEPTSDLLRELDAILAERRGQCPESSYVASLYAKGVGGIARKVGEEATETIIAAMSNRRDELVKETADLWFHSLVLLASAGLDSRDVLAELARRQGISGHDEKRARKANKPDE